jgi:hypothetical protein
MRMGSVLVIATLAAGCDKLFSITEVAVVPGVDALVLRPGCSGMKMLADDFEDGTLMPWWPRRYMTDSLITVVETGGALRIDLAVEGFGEVTSATNLDLRDDGVSVEVRDGGTSLSAEDQIGLELYPESSQKNTISMMRAGNELVMNRVVDNTRFELARIPYDATEHRFWRISKAGDLTRWETSPTGADDWVARVTWPGLDWVTFMNVTLTARRDPGGTPFTAVFDQVNGGVEQGQACQAVQLRDTFDDGAIDEIWRSYAAYGSWTEDGAMVATLDATGPTYSELATNTIYDLTESELAFEVPKMLAQPESSVVLALTTLETTVGTIQEIGGQLQVRNPVGTFAGSAPYDAVAHRWWRIRNHLDTIYWEMSPDGRAYSTFAQMAAPAGIDRSMIQFTISGQPTVPDSLRLDNFNVQP